VTDGDARARLEQRALELEQSLEILRRRLGRPLRPATATPGAASEAAVGTGLVESARGATLCVVHRDGDRLERVRLRTGSYANWPSVAHAAAENLLPDFPLINKSFELCYACADR
jgi:Ni,Fe-hydrogenase III large subunit